VSAIQQGNQGNCAAVQHFVIFACLVGGQLVTGQRRLPPALAGVSQKRCEVRRRPGINSSKLPEMVIAAWLGVPTLQWW